MNRSDWTMLALAAAAGAALEPVQLQKTLFLLGKNLGAETLGEGFYDFAAYDYGPFSKLVYEDAEELERAGLITIARPPAVRYREYRITARGRERATAIASGVPERATRYVTSVVQWVRSLSFNALVSAIYKQYPDMAANSVFTDR